MMNPTKFGSLHLDTRSPRYEFLKLVFKFVKNKKIKTSTQTDKWGPLISRTHASVTLEQGRCFGQPYLTGGEINGDDGDTNVFPTTRRVGWW